MSNEILIICEGCKICGYKECPHIRTHYCSHISGVNDDIDWCMKDFCRPQDENGNVYKQCFALNIKVTCKKYSKELYNSLPDTFEGFENYVINM